MKRFWAALAALICILILAAPPLSMATPLHAVLPNTSSITPTTLLTATNQQRTAAGLPALHLNPLLDQAAQAKANDMAAEDYWAHTSPAGRTPWSFISAAGYSYQAAGENLAYGFADTPAVMAAWMNSPEHRANILSSRYTDVGFALADSSDYVGTGPQTIIVAEYGQPAGPTLRATPPPAAAPVRIIIALAIIPAASVRLSATEPSPTKSSAGAPDRAPHYAPFLAQLGTSLRWPVFGTGRT